MNLMAVIAAVHCCYAGRFRHAIHLRDLPVTHLTFHSSLQVASVAPLHAGKKGVDTHPWNRLTRFRIFSELLNGGLVLGYRHVALHAGRSRREGHHPAGIRIHVAGCAGHSQREVCLMAIGQRLVRRRVRAWIVRHLLLHGARVCGSLRREPPCGRSKKCYRHRSESKCRGFTLHAFTRVVK